MAKFIVRNHNGIYYFRLVLPAHLRYPVTKYKREMRLSLKTAHRPTAIKLAREYWVAMTKKLNNPDSLNTSFPWEDTQLLEHKQECINLAKEYLGIVKQEEKDHIITEQHSGEFFAQHSDMIRDGIALIEGMNKTNVHQSTVAPTTNTTPSVPATRKANGIPMSKVVDAFLKTKGFPNPKTRDDYKVNLNQFAELFVDTPLTELTVEDIDRYFRIYKNVPKNRSKLAKFRGKSLLECIEISKPEEWIDLGTVEKHLNRVRSFIKWAETRHDTMSKGLLTALNQHMQTVKKNKKKSPTVVFTTGHIDAMLSAPEFQDANLFHAYPYRYWGVLIALYTGARINEICQMHLSDIQQDTETGIWFFDFNENTLDKSLKNKASRRKVPIHQELIKLGFLKYVEAERKKDCILLFSQLTQNKYGKYERKLSQFFNGSNGFMVRCGIPQEFNGGKLSFHTFRKTVSTALNRAKIPQHIEYRLVGHAHKDVHSERYIENAPLTDKKSQINKIKFGTVKPAKW